MPFFLKLDFPDLGSGFVGEFRSETYPLACTVPGDYGKQSRHMSTRPLGGPYTDPLFGPWILKSPQAAETQMWQMGMALSVQVPNQPLTPPGREGHQQSRLVST